MPLTNNIQEVIDKLEELKVSVTTTPPPPAFADAMFGALNAGMARMKFRIFNEGMDADGISLGRYVGNKSKTTKGKLSHESGDALTENRRKPSRKRLFSHLKKNPEQFLTEYEKFRISRGRQIDYKDLELDGSLRRSIECVILDNGQVAIAITNDEMAAISGYQEEQIGRITGTGIRIIFALSEDEFEFVKTEGSAAISAVIQSLI